MTTTQRKLLLINGGLGICLTVLAASLDFAQQLLPLERWFYGRRALYCQFFKKPPTDKIVFLDIDQRALETIGKWPWNRSKMAELLDEIVAAKPQTIFLDIIYSDESKVERVEEDGRILQLDHDQRFADSIGRAKNVIVPISISNHQAVAESELQKALRQLLQDDLELTPAQAARALKARGIHLDQDQPWFDLFVSVRRRAMFKRVEAEMARAPTTAAELRERLFTRTDPRQIDSPLIRLLVEQTKRVQKLQPLRRFTRAPDPNMPPLLRPDEEQEATPLVAFGQCAAASGFVDYIPDSDGTIRRIPLLALYHGRTLPQVGLVMACRILGADPTAVTCDDQSLKIPLPDGSTRVVPVTTRAATGGGSAIGALMDIPFVGGTDWKTAFDPAAKRLVQHYPMNLVGQILQTRDSILLNNATADRAISDLRKMFPDRVQEYEAKRPAPDDFRLRLSVLAEFRESVEKFLQAFQGLKDSELDENEKEQKAALLHHQPGLAALIEETQRLGDQLNRQQRELANKLGGKTVLIGSVATSAHDLVPTPLHDACPGVVIHGLIANGIVTKELWRRAPEWITHLITLAMGLAVTALVLLLTPWKAAIWTLALSLSYFAINGVVLFDYGNLIVGVAGPVLAVGLTWLSCQLVEILVEKAERARITRRFASYNDPALVDWIVNHPEQVSMTGEEREMTVVFTDLAGFTALSEKLKEKIVPLLNEYLGIMSAIVSKNGGVVNKFLGDGVMFFFNAPKPNPNHAIDAARTVLEMQSAVDDFNKTLAGRGLPPIAMRAGILTGLMVVGDAGTPERSDYTVLGDNVNLASRLEGANKTTGTKVLMTMRTAELLGDQFIWRPVAKLQVSGKSESVIACELIAPANQATEAQKRLAECSKAVFDCFVQGQFHRCLDAVQCMEESCGPTRLTAVYRDLSQQYITTPPENGFDGSIVLTEK
jgi:class 3 adenylate cyclase/CHASE2 domain-containing sensor protein